MINTLSKMFIKKSLIVSKNIPVYYFIIGRMFKKQKPAQENLQQKQQQTKIQDQLYERQIKRMKIQVQDENQYDFIQRQKDIQLNRDFRKQKQMYKNTIPQGIGKSGFNELVYWSQNAFTPQQILQLITKFNNCPLPKQIQDKPTFISFVQNVKSTVYLAQSYKSMVQYAHFGYKYTIKDQQYWLKMQEKIMRKPCKTEEEQDSLIDIIFVMGNMQQGDVLYSATEKVLQAKQLKVEQITKLIIAYFKTGKGQKDWILNLLVSLEMQVDQINSEILQSILPILKQSKNIPISFEQKIQNRIMQLRNDLSLSTVCAISSYFGYEKGKKQLWQLLQQGGRLRIKQLKSSRGKIPAAQMSQIISSMLSSYKFSEQLIKTLILPNLIQKKSLILYQLSPTTLSTLSKCLYIYQMQKETSTIQQIIQGLIMKHFQKVQDVQCGDLVQVLKDYTVSRIGTRQFYLGLEQVVNLKLADIKTQRYTIQALLAIYQESNLCSTDTLELLRGLMAQ